MSDKLIREENASCQVSVVCEVLEVFRYCETQVLPTEVHVGLC